MSHLAWNNLNFCRTTTKWALGRPMYMYNQKFSLKWSTDIVRPVSPPPPTPLQKLKNQISSKGTFLNKYSACKGI